MAMVSNKFLGALAAKLKFHRHLQHFSNPIQTNITSYAEEIQTAEDESEGAMVYWLSTRDSPKACSAWKEEAKQWYQNTVTG
jgi:endoribonuclease Dicer